MCFFLSSAKFSHIGSMVVCTAHFWIRLSECIPQCSTMISIIPLQYHYKHSKMVWNTVVLESHSYKHSIMLSITHYFITSIQKRFEASGNIIQESHCYKHSIILSIMTLHYFITSVAKQFGNFGNMIQEPHCYKHTRNLTTVQHSPLFTSVMT